MNFSGKRLTKNRQNKIIAGVCAGVADYLEMDPTVVRLIWAILSCSGLGLAIYIVAALIMPNE